MNTAKVAITINEEILTKLDKLVKMHIFPNRSRAIQDAIVEKLNRMERSRLACESSRLDSKFEKSMAEEGFSDELGNGQNTKGRYYLVRP